MQIQYSNSPNESTAFVVQEGGQKNRAVLTAAQDTSTLELPDNPNSTKGYVTIDGKKHKVVLVADIAGGGSGGGAVSSVNGQTGEVVLDAEDVDAKPEIDWVAKADLETGTYPSVLYVRVADGLPDGTYEFYTQVKNSYYDSSYPLADTTCKVILNVKTQEGESYPDYYAIICPVIDGEWSPYVQMQDTQTATSVYFDGTDIILGLGGIDTFYTNIPHRTGASLAVQDCFKVSSIKNVDTGTGYTPTLSLEMPASYSTTRTMRIVSNTLDELPSIPNHFYYAGFYFYQSDYLALGSIYASSNNPTEEVSLNLQYGSDLFVSNIKFLSQTDWKITISKATGVFENSQFVTSLDQVYLKLNAPVGTQGLYYVRCAYIGASSSIWAGVNAQAPDGAETVLEALKVGCTVTPTNIGTILQYQGTTDSNYTNGYFYKATGTEVTVPADMEISYMSPNDLTLSISNVSDFITAMATSTGWSVDDIQRQFAEGTGFNGYWDADNDAITVISIGFYGEITDPTVLAYLSMSTTGTYSGDVYFTSTATYIPAHPEIQNGSWERVDVQPTSTVPSTMPTLLAANWSSNTQTVSVTGVTANNVVFVSPAPASATDYSDAGILCTAQGAGTLTFTCANVPSNDITVNVICL